MCGRSLAFFLSSTSFSPDIGVALFPNHTPRPAFFPLYSLRGDDKTPVTPPTGARPYDFEETTRPPPDHRSLFFFPTSWHRHARIGLFWRCLPWFFPSARLSASTHPTVWSFPQFPPLTGLLVKKGCCLFSGAPTTGFRRLSSLGSLGLFFFAFSDILGTIFPPPLLPSWPYRPR